MGSVSFHNDKANTPFLGSLRRMDACLRFSLSASCAWSIRPTADPTTSPSASPSEDSGLKVKTHARVNFDYTGSWFFPHMNRIFRRCFVCSKKLLVFPCCPLDLPSNLFNLYCSFLHAKFLYCRPPGPHSSDAKTSPRISSVTFSGSCRSAHVSLHCWRPTSIEHGFV